MSDPGLDSPPAGEPPSESEKKEIIENARDGLQSLKKRFLGFSAAFLLSCASVYPFLFGHSLHAYWQSCGKYLVMLSMGLLIPFLYYAGQTCYAWLWLRYLQYLRNSESK